MIKPAQRPVAGDHPRLAAPGQQCLPFRLYYQEGVEAASGQN